MYLLLRKVGGVKCDTRESMESSSYCLSYYSTLINTHRTNKTYDELFEAFIDARTLINKQTEYINELTEYMKNVNEKYNDNESLINNNKYELDSNQ